MSTDTVIQNSALAALEGDTLDVLVVGGGIVGAGVARDAAMRGLRTGLVEQYDFASGTSSRSSRLLHGGMRYLAQGRLGLVREASVEKRTIHRIAPHLAKPLGFVFPAFAGQSDWPLWQLKVGVKLYDALCGWRNLGHSTWLGRKQALEATPGLREEGLQGAVRYFDGLTNDARLVIDTLRSAARYGALLANHVCLERASRKGGGWRCEVVDEHTGRTHGLYAGWVVNAAGPWANRLPNSTLPLRLTKGVHLVISRERLPIPDAVVLPEGRRILFAIPWGERVILGTTDTDHTGALEEVRCDPADIEYIFSVVNARFPGAFLQLEDALSCWAGVRPLVAGKSGHPSDASRSHVIKQSGEQWLEVGGGKLTTYRLMAQEVVDKIGRGVRGNRTRPCRTAEEPLLDASETQDHLSAIVPPEVCRRAVEHFCRHEWATHLEDVMVRRSSWHYYMDAPAQVARQVAAWMAPCLGWDAQRVQQELDSYGQFARTGVGTLVKDMNSPACRDNQEIAK